MLPCKLVSVSAGDMLEGLEQYLGCACNPDKPQVYCSEHHSFCVFLSPTHCHIYRGVSPSGLTRDSPVRGNVCMALAHGIPSIILHVAGLPELITFKQATCLAIHDLHSQYNATEGDLIITYRQASPQMF